MDHYGVEIHGLKVKVTIADDPVVVEQTISQLKSGDLIGLDIKDNGVGQFDQEMLIICSGSRCLIVPYLSKMLSNKIEHRTISSLKQLFASSKICCVGISLELERRFRSYPSLEVMMSEKGVELSDLAARVLKKRELESSSLYYIAGKVGLDIKQQSSVFPESFGYGVFSLEEIKYVIHNASASYLIGKKLLGML